MSDHYRICDGIDCDHTCHESEDTCVLCFAASLTAAKQAVADRYSLAWDRGDDE